MGTYKNDPDNVGGRGHAIYEDLRPRLGHVEKGMFVVIDVETGNYEIDKRDAEATWRLMQRNPSAVTWAVRVGYAAPLEHLGLVPVASSADGSGGTGGSGMNGHENDPDDIVGRGDAIFRDQLEPHIGHVEKGMFVVIDVESGDYEIGERDVEATSRLMERRPAAMTHAVRIGYPTAYEYVGLWPTRSNG